MKVNGTYQTESEASEGFDEIETCCVCKEETNVNSYGLCEDCDIEMEAQRREDAARDRRIED